VGDKICEQSSLILHLSLVNHYFNRENSNSILRLCLFCNFYMVDYHY